MEKGKIKFKFNIKKRLLPVILLSVCLPLILFVAIPFEVYANNMDEFLFSLGSFFPLSILFGFLLAAAIACSLLFLPEKSYRICYALVLALSFLFFLQGTFLNFGMNSLAGDNLGTASANVGLKLLDLFIWIAVIAAAVVLAIIKDKKGIIAIVAVILSIVVIATQIINPLANTFKHPDVFMTKAARLAEQDDGFKDEVLTRENLSTLSDDRNIVYICIDRFDEFFAETAYTLKPEIFEELDGFTWFKDHLSLYGHTFPSIAYMLTENEYDSDIHRKDYLSTVYDENNTLSTLAENGYSVNIYTQAYYAFNTASDLPDYVANVSEAKEFTTSRPMKLLGCMLGTSAYRCLPLFLKDLIYGVESRKFNECVSSVGVNGYDGYLTDNDTVYNQTSASPFELREGKNFSFVHIEGCHDITFDYISKNLTSKQKSRVAASVQNSFRVVNEYIKALKDAGLYENSTIIITGDHPDPIGSAAPKGAKLTALFFKRAGSYENGITPSYAPVAHKNIWPAIMNSEGIDRVNNGTSLFDIPEYDETRVRQYIWHTYESNRCDEYTYSITGSGTDFNNWELVSTKHINRFIMN
ncbi:MAG: hypothetical protein K2H30_05875 [Clostridia bacterium]|nr:hypothetical protein [Clostridia bacterium]